MKVIQDVIGYIGQYLTIVHRHFLDRKGNEKVWDMPKRSYVPLNKYSEIVAIVAITENKQIILERNFRVPMNDYVYELPAGLMDKKNEPGEEAAERELLEETGYATNNKLELMLSGPFHPGTLDDIMYIYFADDVKKIQKPELEDGEEIEVILVPLKEFREFIKKHQSELIDIKVSSVIPYLQDRGFDV